MAKELHKDIELFLENEMEKGDALVAFVPVSNKKELKIGHLILTKKKLVFLSKGIAANTLREISLDRIMGIEFEWKTFSKNITLKKDKEDDIWQIINGQFEDCEKFLEELKKRTPGKPDITKIGGKDSDSSFLNIFVGTVGVLFILYIITSLFGEGGKKADLINYVKSPEYAHVECKKLYESMAEYDVNVPWNGTRARALSDQKVRIYIDGKMQNGFGAWKKVPAKCDFMADGQLVDFVLNTGTENPVRPFEEKSPEVLIPTLSKTDLHRDAPKRTDIMKSSDIKRIKELYLELLNFKVSRQFIDLGFARTGPYHIWLSEVQELQGNLQKSWKEGLDQETDDESHQLLNDTRIAAIDLLSLGLDYVSSKGKEVENTVLYRNELNLFFKKHGSSE